MWTTAYVVQTQLKDTIELQIQIQSLFSRGGFLLRKWNSSHPTVLEHLTPDVKDSRSLHSIPNQGEYTKTLGIDWNPEKDTFRLTVADFPAQQTLTKRLLTSDIAKTFDVLGCFSPATVKAKILLQKLWEQKIDWDEAVPPDLLRTWSRWRMELPLLSSKQVSRCYSHGSLCQCWTQLHGFCDASKDAYAAFVYLHLQHLDGTVDASVVTSKT